MTNRSTEAEFELRCTEVSMMLLDGSSRQTICRFAIEKWQVSVAQVDRYIAKARESIQANCSFSRKSAFALILEKYDYLYERCIQEGDLRTAASILAEQRKMCQLDEVAADLEFAKSPAARVSKMVMQEIVREKMLARPDE